jgi:hypothetical protein
MARISRHRSILFEIDCAFVIMLDLNLVRSYSNIMRTETFHAQSLIALFRRHRIATMQQMKAALGTTVDMTVFRELRELSYYSSYSHRGSFYTLETLAEFDERGLWTYRGVQFSRFGSLIDTVEQLVTRSDRGFFTSELQDEIQIEVK